jgi:uncharacterized protein with HEPN domain
MSRDEVYLLDILDAARLAMEYLRGKTREQFLEDVQAQDAVIRRLAVMGEAARRVSEARRRSLPQLPWREIIGIRNLVVHEYDDVDVGVVWDTVSRDLPALVAALEELLPPPSP